MKTFEDFFVALPEHEQALVMHLREIILGEAEHLREQLSYGVPYYFQHSRVCFIWPASSPFANIQQGVMLGFCNGNLLSGEQGLMEMGNRKQVSTVVFQQVKEIPARSIREILHEALLLDEKLFSARAKKIKK